MAKINLIAKGGMFLVLITLLTSFVFAFGVASSYKEGRPLTMSPGESKTISTIRLQNTGEKDITVRVEIAEGGEIAKIEGGDIYLVEAGTRDTEVLIKFEIPAEASIGTKYPIKLSSKTVTSGEEGGVAFGVGYDTSFNVQVVAEPTEPATTPAESSSKTWIIVIIVIIGIIIIAIAVVIYVLSRKRNKSEIVKSNKF